jgi:DNA-binding response OmpR family regulator
MKILVVDDEKRIAKSIKQGLEMDGYAVDIEHDGEDGYNAARADDYDLIILDVMMPIMNGFEVAKKLRADGNKTPILMLTAKDQNKDIVEGLDSGADDYLPKPFSFEVLGARVRALLRRPQDVLDNILTVRDLELDIANHTAERAGKDIKLSNKEFAILEYLLRNKNQILSKQNIMTHVWDFDADILPNNVEVFINYLRNKIDKPFPGTDPIIQTVRGFGYIVKDEIRKA